MISSRWYVAGACPHIRCGTPTSQTFRFCDQFIIGWGRARIYAAARLSHTTNCLTKEPQMQQQAHRLTHPAGHRTSKARQQPSQQQPAAAQEQPGRAWSSQEQPRAARESQEQPEAARSSQERPGTARSSQQQPGQPAASRSSEEQPGAAGSRSSQEQ